MAAGLLGLPSIATGQGSSPSQSIKSAAESAAESTAYQSTGAFTVGSSQHQVNVIFIIAGVVALAFLFLNRK